MFELITGHPLFYIDPFEDSDVENDHHLLMFSDILGPLPEDLYVRWTRASRYYDAERVKFNTLLHKAPKGTDPFSNQWRPLEEFFDENKPGEVLDDEAKMVKDLLRRILQYDLVKRPTPSQILQDPWFAI